jgi:spermidine/putrescine transport system ATP-binding protein
VIRPERIALAGADEPIAPGRNVMRGLVRDIVYLGASTQVHVELNGARVLTVEVANHDGPTSVAHAPGTTVQCVCTPDAVRVLRRSSAAAPDDVDAAPPAARAKVHQ